MNNTTEYPEFDRQSYRIVLKNLHNLDRAVALLAAEIDPQTGRELVYIWSLAAAPANRLIMMAQQARYDSRAVSIVRALMAFQLVSDSERLPVERALTPYSPELPAARRDRPPGPPPAPAEPPAVRLDPELARICQGLRIDSMLRLWAILKHYAGHKSKLHKKNLLECLRIARDYAPRHYRRLLQQGRGLFWKISPGGDVYLTGSARLSGAVVNLAYQQGRGDLVGTNPPGKRDVFIPVGGSLRDWRVNIYAAWLSYRGNPTISRARLSTLFGRDETTLRQWDRGLVERGVLRIRRNYAQMAIAPDNHDYIHMITLCPSSRVNPTWDGRVLISRQLPNSYYIQGFKQAPRRGKARRRYSAASAARSGQQPDAGYKPEARRYFEDFKQLERYNKRRAEPAPGFVFLGENRRGRRVWELCINDQRTGSESRARGRTWARLWGEWQATYNRIRRYLKRTKIPAPNALIEKEDGFGGVGNLGGVRGGLSTCG